MLLHPKVEDKLEELDLNNSIQRTWYGAAEGAVVPEVFTELRVYDDSPEGHTVFWVYLDDDGRVFHFPDPTTTWVEGLPPGACTYDNPPK